MMKYVNERIAEILYINNERAVIRSDYIVIRWLCVYFFFLSLVLFTVHTFPSIIQRGNSLYDGL